MKGYKVTNSERLEMFGVACNTLAQLRSKGSAKLNLGKNVILALEDGTIIDDEEYFRMVPPQSVIIFYRENEAILTGADHILKMMRKMHEEYLTAGDMAREFMSKGAREARDILLMLERKSEEMAGDRKSSTRDEDPDWFRDLETNAKTKEEYMFRKSQDRIKGYLYKFQGDIRKNRTYLEDSGARRKLNECLTYFKGKLSEDRYFGCFFDRRCAPTSDADGDEVDVGKWKKRSEGVGIKKWRKSKGEAEEISDASEMPTYDRLSYCDGEGKFLCQGKWNSRECEFGTGHAINPYSSRESRILFSTWNLDHRIEKTRTVVPTLLDVVHNRKLGDAINYEYFYRLLFTNFNLKLVHAVCHDKSLHEAYCDMRYVYRR